LQSIAEQELLYKWFTDQLMIKEVVMVVVVVVVIAIILLVSTASDTVAVIF